MAAPRSRHKEIAALGVVALAVAAAAFRITHTDLGNPDITDAAADPVILAAGDIASCGSSGDEATARLLAAQPSAPILTLGDNVYESGTASEFANCYNPSWGPFKARTHPAPGNHDYLTSGAAGYFGFFGGNAGPSVGYYVYDIGTWRVYSLNSNCSPAGGCSATSPQGRWLAADLAAHPASCALAYWHHPRWSSGQHGSQTSMDPIWRILANAKADVVLSGHDHDYERFGAMNSVGAADPNGVQEFVVGTGGKNHYVIGSPIPNSQVRNQDTFGVLQMTLHPTSYDWQFLPVAGKSFTDAGSRPCTGLPTSATATPTPSATALSTPSATPASTSTAIASATPTVQPSASATVAATATPDAGGSLTLPIRAIFAYPWFPELWHRPNGTVFTHYSPSLGFYDSSDPAVIRQQVAAMQYGHIQAGISSWWGQGTKTDQRLPTILAATAGTGFKWAVYYEMEGSSDPSAASISADLAYLQERAFTDPSYLRVAGRPVVFVYGDAGDGCAMVDRWKQGANLVSIYAVLKVFPGYRQCANQPQGWHQYSPAVAVDSQAGYSYSISPGFWHADEASPRLGRDLNRWRANIQSMKASGAPWQLVTTFNEWGEGTAVEQAQEWATASGFGAYLDALAAVP